MHEALVHSCSSSVKGYGAYSFASKSGVDLLFNDKEFHELFEKEGYSLVVGIDEITNIECLESLNNLMVKVPNFSVRAFYHEDNGSLFHPKLSFFKDVTGGGSLLVGSGNLTFGGLRKNREAFSLISLSLDEYQRVENYWNKWVHEAQNHLKLIDDQSVVDRVSKNIYIRSHTVKKPLLEGEEESFEIRPPENAAPITEGWEFSGTNRVLLAEIPKSGDRWKQANFDLETFRHFFGAMPGDNSQRILLRSLSGDALLAPIEVRPSVSVKSQNYRFELDAATGLAYPTDGKPVGIFVQITTRMFLYHLFMPSHELYPEIIHRMNSLWRGRRDRMIRIVVEANEIFDLLDKSVFQHYKSA